MPNNMMHKERRRTAHDLTVENDSRNRDENVKAVDEKGKVPKFLSRFLPDSAVKEDGSSKNRQFLVEPTDYRFTSSFIHHNGQVAALVRLYVRRGSNRHLSYVDVLDIIPRHPSPDVKIYFIERDGKLSDTEKHTAIKENATSSQQVISNEKRDEANGHAGHKKDASEREMDAADISDYQAYELILDGPDPVMFFDINLLVVGPSEEVVDAQIDDINVALRQSHAGMEWGNVAGDQATRFRQLFFPLEQDYLRADSSIGSNYAGFNFAASPGLCDERGIAIGNDVLALVNASAIFDANGSTKGYASIAIPDTEKITLYEPEDETPHVSSASIIAQAVANDIVCNGHRAAHLVFNGFDYVGKTIHDYTRPVDSSAFCYYDVSRVSINPLQGFGSLNDVVNVFSRLTNKIVNIFDLLTDLSFEGDQHSMENKALVLRAVNQFYINQKLWASDAAIHPARTNIVNVQHPETYPTLGIFISEFTNIVSAYRKQGDHAAGSRAEALHDTLDSALGRAMSMIGSHTDISPSGALQDFYDFSRIGDETLRQVQAVNILDYVLFTLRRGDLLVIHGADMLWKITIGSMLNESLRAAVKRGVRIIFVFDTVTTPNTNPSNDLKNGSDMFSLRDGGYYTNLDSDFSWSMVGPMMDDELARYSKAMGNIAVSDTVRVQATGLRGQCQVLMHRNAGNVNNFITLMPVI